MDRADYLLAEIEASVVRLGAERDAARINALEEAAQLLDRWVAGCDLEDYDEAKMADHYSHAAEQIRLLKEKG